jgi:bifunctional non-homologous end joining protein LigD
VAFQRKKPADIGVKAAFPGFIEPALASSIEKVPSGDRWLHEIKFDGYRVQLHLANDIKVHTQRGNDWTKRFKRCRRRLLDQRQVRDYRRRDRGARR